MTRSAQSNHPRAYQANDQMFCPTCGKQWDMNDPDPPKCEKINLQRAAYEAFIERVFGVKTKWVA